MTSLSRLFVSLTDRLAGGPGSVANAAGAVHRDRVAARERAAVRVAVREATFRTSARLRGLVHQNGR